MADAACLFEPFHEAPSLDEVLACLRKLLNARHAGTLDQARAVERAWLLCAGRPDEALASLQARKMRGWPHGFYELPSLRLSLVVLSELPVDDDTLALRLMGAGATFRAALDDLRSRFGHVPRGRELFETVIQEFLTARQRATPLTENAMVDTSEARAFIDRVWSEGLARERHLLTRQFEHRLARDLTEAERATFAARFEALGADRLGELVLDHDAAALAMWLANPTAT